MLQSLRVVQVGDRLVGPVDGQGVLDQVVGADREEVEVAQEQRDGQRRGGHLDHGAQAHDAVQLRARIQLGAGLVDKGQGLADLAGMGQHGNEQVDRPER